MLLAVRLARHVQSALTKCITIDDTSYFCDSAINFFRLRHKPANYKIWVKNRLTEILKFSHFSEWIHIPTHLNAADILSRGTS